MRASNKSAYNLDSKTNIGVMKYTKDDTAGKEAKHLMTGEKAYIKHGALLGFTMITINT